MRTYHIRDDRMSWPRQGDTSTSFVKIIIVIENNKYLDYSSVARFFYDRKLSKIADLEGGTKYCTSFPYNARKSDKIGICQKNN